MARGTRSLPLNVAEYEPLAHAAMENANWDYISSGAGDEFTLRENLAAFQRLQLHYRVLVDVTGRSTATEVLGTPVAAPILVAPTAFHKLAHRDGELATVRAAGAEGSIMVLSTLSTTAVEEVVAAATGPVWFQLYIYKDREATRALVERVETAGVRALVFTVDAPLLGRRERDIRNGFVLPPKMHLENVRAGGDLPKTKGSALAAYFASLLDPALTWKDVEWLRSISRLPIIVKGIVRGDDAGRAVDHGAGGIIVSNHGGRQLDTAPATIDVLEEVVGAVNRGAEVMLDGGIRRGTDVVKALALGARAVLVGRPALWGLAANGETGVRHVLHLLREELELAMALCGCPRVVDLRRDLVRASVASTSRTP